MIKWDKYLSQASNQAANNNLNFLIDPTFTNVNRLFVLSFKNDDDNRNNRTSFSTYYLPKVQVKDFNVIIDKTPFFDQPVKMKKKRLKKLLKFVETVNITQEIYWIMIILKNTTG